MDKLPKEPIKSKIWHVNGKYYQLIRITEGNAWIDPGVYFVEVMKVENGQALPR